MQEWLSRAATGSIGSALEFFAGERALEAAASRAVGASLTDAEDAPGRTDYEPEGVREEDGDHGGS